VITGYLLAGSAVGPGGFSFVSELVQVETVAQFGVVFLLFALGLEFSMSKVQTFHLSLQPQFKNQNFRVLLWFLSHYCILRVV
jgi:Kef-type K+ transport system membrane component KefB